MSNTKKPITSGLRKVGSIVYFERNGKVYSRSAHRRSNSDKRSDAQMTLWLKQSSVQLQWRQLKDILARNYETKTPGQSDYAAFLHANNRFGVYLTQSQRECHNCIALPLQISSGTLTPIEQHLDEDGCVVTNLDLGDLVMDENTTVDQFFQALGSDFRWGDKLQFVIVRQEMWQTYCIKPEAYSLEYGRGGDRKLLAVVEAPEFLTQKGNFVATRPLPENCCACFIHVRDYGAHPKQVSTQTLLNHNEAVIAQFTNDEQYEEARYSYLTPYQRKKDKEERGLE